MKYMHMISRERGHSKGQGVGVKGRLELSRKFIPFDSFFSLGLLIPVTRPLKQAVLQKTPTSDSEEVS